MRASRSGLIGRNQVQEIITAIDARGVRPRGSGGNYYRNQITWLGPAFTRLVLDAAEGQALTLSNAAGLLKAKVHQFDRLARDAGAPRGVRLTAPCSSSTRAHSIAAWHYHYSPTTFPSVWEVFAEALIDGRMIAPRAVDVELEHKDDDVARWAHARASPGRNGENGATFRLHSRGASYGLTEALCDGFLLEVEVDAARSEWELDIDNGESECEGSGFLDGSRFEIEVLRPGKIRLVHPSNDIYGRMDTTLRLPES